MGQVCSSARGTSAVTPKAISQPSISSVEIHANENTHKSPQDQLVHDLLSDNHSTDPSESPRGVTSPSQPKPTEQHPNPLPSDSNAEQPKSDTAVHEDPPTENVNKQNSETPSVSAHNPVESGNVLDLIANLEADRTNSDLDLRDDRAYSMVVIPEDHDRSASVVGDDETPKPQSAGGAVDSHASGGNTPIGPGAELVGDELVRGDDTPSPNDKEPMAMSAMAPTDASASPAAFLKRMPSTGDDGTIEETPAPASEESVTNAVAGPDQSAAAGEQPAIEAGQPADSTVFVEVSQQPVDGPSPSENAVDETPNTGNTESEVRDTVIETTDVTALPDEQAIVTAVADDTAAPAASAEASVRAQEGENRPTVSETAEPSKLGEESRPDEASEQAVLLPGAVEEDAGKEPDLGAPAP